ncbi:MAG TPA: AAA family ATPase [Aggregatilineales bacterium]|nr:AAA family ATPase [Aggregatilineales bacterium]
MQVNRLTLTNVRAFQQAEFEFQPGMNLLVGVNGAGKSTVLDVLRRMYARWVPGSTKEAIVWSRDEDITIGQPFMIISAQLDFYGQPFTYNYQLQRETVASNPDAHEGQVRDSAYEVPEIDELRDADRQIVSGLRFSKTEPPLVVFFSPHRSVSETERKASRSKRERANNLALEPRGLNVQELALWWLVQESLRAETSGQVSLFGEIRFNLNHALNSALHGFLDTYGDVYPVGEPKPTLQIEKGEMVLDVLQLSDGERSMIAVVLDLARRLALANPHLSDPLREGRAVVLIDELDLHLHPAWQRTICERLTSTFPNCQFIASTHSPQIIGEVSSENIIIIENGKAIRPRQSLGMDTNWILKYLMDVPDRNVSTQDMLVAIETLIEQEEYEQALGRIAEVRQAFGDFPELAALQAQIEMMTFLADEAEADEK